MDHATLVLLIPILALTTGLVVVLRLPRKIFTRRSDPGLGARVQALEEEIDRLRHQLTDAHERLDFTERLLAQADESRHLEKGQ